MDREEKKRKHLIFNLIVQAMKEINYHLTWTQWSYWLMQKKKKKAKADLRYLVKPANTYLKMLNLLMIKTVLLLQPAVQEMKHKAHANGKSKKKKEEGCW